MIQSHSNHNKAKEFLIKSENILEERGKQYGNSDILHAAIAKRFSMVLNIPVTPYIVARLMIELKLARLDVGRFSDDSIYDIINYTALAGQMKNNELKVPLVKPLDKENDPMFQSRKLNYES
jgi:hypothetical protein